jgi:hypothetical protein
MPGFAAFDGPSTGAVLTATTLTRGVTHDTLPSATDISRMFP